MTLLSCVSLSSQQGTLFTQDIPLNYYVKQMRKRVEKYHMPFLKNMKFCTIMRVTGALCYYNGSFINIYIRWRNKTVRFHYSFQAQLYYSTIGVSLGESITEELLLHICDICELLSQTAEFEYGKVLLPEIGSADTEPGKDYGIHWAREDNRRYVLYNGADVYIPILRD